MTSRLIPKAQPPVKFIDLPKSRGILEDYSVRKHITSKEIDCSNKIGFNSTGGLMIKLTNNTGSATVKGSVVSSSNSVDNAFKLQSDEFDAIGVVYESGISDGAEAWIVVSGIAEVLFKDGVASVREYLALSADTDGRATCVEVPNVNPVVAEHFKEIGHTLESKDAGTNVLVKCVLHFN
jgi:hypothetical protein